MVTATYLLVAGCAWTNGWIAGRHHQQHRHTEAMAWEALRPPISVIDLTGPRAYDWSVDGDAHGRTCRKCTGRGWITIRDWTRSPVPTDLVVDCPACQKVPT